MDHVAKNDAQNGSMMDSPDVYSGGGLVFTNNTGQVIFVNQAFLDALSIERRSATVGKPLHQVLGVSNSEMHSLLETGRGRGDTTRAVKLEVRDQRGRTRKLWLESMPAFDNCNRYLGLNILVKVQAEAAPPPRIAQPLLRPEEAERYASAVPLPMQQPSKEATRGERLRQFFIDQVDTLQILMARVAGLRVRDAMELIFNETAQKHLWAAAMVDGNVYLDASAEDPRVYHTLLSEMATYAAMVIGWKAVSAEMHKLETHTQPAILALVNETGLRSAYTHSE